MNTTQFAATHLTEEQFTDHILGMATGETEDHLLQCELCTAEAQTLQNSIAAYSKAGQRWSKDQPAPPMRSLRARALVYSLRPVIGFAAAAIAVVSIAIPVGRSQRAATAGVAMVDHVPQVVPRVPPAQPAASVLLTQHEQTVRHADVQETDAVLTEENLQQDNALMAAIDEEIAQPVSSAAESVMRSSSDQ